LNQSGNRIIACDLAGAYLWDTQTGKVLTLFTDIKTSHHRINSVLYRPDCERVLTIDYSSLKLWDADGKNLVNKYGHHSAGTFSPDNSLVAYFGRNALYVCDASTGKEKYQLATSFRPLVSAMDPTKEYVAAGDVVGRIKIWNIVSGQEVMVIVAHKTRIESIAFSKDRRKLISVGRDGTIGVWAFPRIDVRQPETILDGRTSAGTIALSSDGSLAAIMANEKVTILDIENSSEISSVFRPYVPGPMYFSVDFSATDSLVAWDVHRLTESPPGITSTIEIWNPRKSEKVRELECNNVVTAIAIDANDRLLSSGHRGGIDIWDLAKGKKLRACSFTANWRSADDIAFDPQGRIVCAGGGKNTTGGVIAVWDLAEGECQWEITPDAGVASVAFSPDGEYIASGKTDGMVEIVHAGTGEETLSFYHGGVVGAVWFSPDGKNVLSGGSHGTIKIWDALSGFEKLTLDVPGEATVEVVVLNPERKQVIAGCNPSKILVWKSEGHHAVDAAAQGLVQPGMNLERGSVRRRVTFDSAIEYFTRAIQSDPNNPRNLYQRAIAFSGKRLIKEAIADVSRAIALDADHRDYWRLRGRLHGRIRAYDQAIRDLTKVLQIDPNDSRSYYERGLGYYETEQYENALADFSEAIALNVQDPNNWYGGAHAGPRTIAQKKAVAEDAPTVNAQLCNQLASLYATCPRETIRNGQRAVELATKACESTQWSNADYVGTLASAHAESGDFEPAIEMQERRIALYAEHRGGHVLDEHEDRLEVYVNALNEERAKAIQGGPAGESIWVGKARAPIPSHGKRISGFSPTVELTWQKGESVVHENVFFGKDPSSLDLLRSVGGSGSVELSQLEPQCQYYWRVDGIGADGSKRVGETWSFTTGLPATLVCHFTFDDDLSDCSGHELHGTAVGDATIVADPNRGSVLSLDGDADWIDCGNDKRFNITKEITISAWIKVSRFDRQWEAIVAKGDTAWRLQRDRTNDVVEFACQGTDVAGSPHGSLYSTVSVNDKSWHHVVGTYDGRRLSLYIDGRLDASQNASGLMFTNNYPVLIGDNGQKDGRTWAGMIDDVRVYNCALDVNEVKALYQEELR
jgi:WD40 repeat protein/tetratricopeptide (TPR) repeat protein